jgi:hypothetical protein
MLAQTITSAIIFALLVPVVVLVLRSSMNTRPNPFHPGG